MIDFPRPPVNADIAAGLVVFTTAADAEPGDVLGPLAELLIDLRRKRLEREAQQQKSPGGNPGRKESL